MGKRFNPADYNLTINPSLPKTNSPWRLWLLLLLCAIVIALCWSFLTPEIRLTRPDIVGTAGHITATTRATNRTTAPVTLNVRIIVGTKGPDEEFGSGQFHRLAHQDVVATIPPRSSVPISCDFSFSNGAFPKYAEAQLLDRR
jgi:hypothetical protein